jgi:hypothetical protein
MKIQVKKRFRFRERKRKKRKLGQVFFAAAGSMSQAADEYICSSTKRYSFWLLRQAKV